MDWVHTSYAIGVIGLSAIAIYDFIIVMIVNHHPKYSKNKILHKKMFLTVGVSFILSGVFLLLYAMPIFYAKEIPVNMKIALGILIFSVVGFAAWAVKYNYNKYKAKEASTSSLEIDIAKNTNR